MIPSDLDSESGSPLVDGVRSLSSSGRLGSLHLRPVFPPTAVCAFAQSSSSHTHNQHRNPASILDCKYVNILAGVYRSALIYPSLKNTWTTVFSMDDATMDDGKTMPSCAPRSMQSTSTPSDVETRNNNNEHAWMKHTCLDEARGDESAVLRGLRHPLLGRSSEEYALG